MKVHSRANHWRLWALRLLFIFLLGAIFWLIKVKQTDYIFLIAFLLLAGSPIRLASLDIYQDRVVLKRHYFFGLINQQWNFTRAYYLRKFYVEFNPILDSAGYSVGESDDLLPLGCLLFSLGIFTPGREVISYKVFFIEDCGYGETRTTVEPILKTEYHLLKDLFKESDSEITSPTQNPS